MLSVSQYRPPQYQAKFHPNRAYRKNDLPSFDPHCFGYNYNYRGESPVNQVSRCGSRAFAKQNILSVTSRVLSDKWLSTGPLAAGGVEAGGGGVVTCLVSTDGYGVINHKTDRLLP